MAITLDELLVDFKKYLSRGVTDNEESQKSYVSYVKALDKANGGLTMSWLEDAVSRQDPIKHLSQLFDNYFAKTTKINKQTKDHYKVGLKWLGKYVCGFNNSIANLQSNRRFEQMACQLIAQSAIFCPVDVFKSIVEREGGNKYGSWDNCSSQRAKSPQKPNEKIEGITLDSNNKANYAIKAAILEGLKKYGIYKKDVRIFKGFEACHIWPKSCYDRRYHTSVANLVLIPREIAGLTDHCDAVVELLKYEAWKRFGFWPDDEPNPHVGKNAKCPKYYKTVVWRSTIE